MLYKFFVALGAIIIVVIAYYAVTFSRVSGMACGGSGKYTIGSCPIGYYCQIVERPDCIPQPGAGPDNECTGQTGVCRP